MSHKIFIFTLYPVSKKYLPKDYYCQSDTIKKIKYQLISIKKEVDLQNIKCFSRNHFYTKYFQGLIFGL